jgi:hypothetical protein
VGCWEKDVQHVFVELRKQAQKSEERMGITTARIKSIELSRK